jgi:hypothetical protein
LAAGDITAGNLARQFLEQLQAQRRIGLEGLMEGVQRQQYDQARRLRAERVSMGDVAEGCGEFNQVSSAGHAQNEPRGKTICLTQKLAGSYDIEPSALFGLAEDELTHAQIERLRCAV